MGPVGQLSAARTEPRAPHLADFIELGLHTGARLQEMLALDWSRVDLEHHLIYLPAIRNKSKRNVSIPLNATAFAVLTRRAAFRDEHCPNSPWVFANKRGKRIASVKKSFSTACRRAGITDFHPHDLRHTCAAWLVQARVPILEVRDLLGHATVAVTEKYAHLDPDKGRDTVCVLDDASRSRHVGPPTLRLVKGGK